MRKLSIFKNHIRGRMTLFLIVMLFFLSVVIVNGMMEGALMGLNGLYMNSEYPVRFMQAMYTTQMLDDCVGQSKKTPELIAVDERMSELLSQESVMLRGMFVLYTDDGESFKYVTGVGGTEASFGEAYTDRCQDDDSSLIVFREAFDRGDSLTYFTGFNTFRDAFIKRDLDHDKGLINALYETEDEEVILRAQMLRGEHTYFLCADVGRNTTLSIDILKDGEDYFDNSIGGKMIAFVYKIYAIMINDLIIIYILAIVLMFLLIGRTVEEPIRKLAEAAGKLENTVRKENDPKRWVYESPKIKTGDEIQYLAQSFEEMFEGLKQTAGQLMDELVVRERLNTELSLAGSIQNNVLISEFPAFPERKDFDIIAKMTPAKAVGGDFYDFFLADEDHLVFLIADVSSKGIPAALFMMQAKTLLRSGFVYSTDIEQIFATVNDHLCEGNEESMFVTCWMGMIELSTGKLSIVDAGHEPALLIRGGECEEIPTNAGLVLGVAEGIVYEKNIITLHPGDKVFLYTDGLNEAQNKEQAFYGLESLKVSVADHSRENIKTLMDSVLSDIAGFVGDADQFDDQTVVVFEYRQQEEA